MPRAMCLPFVLILTSCSSRIGMPALPAANADTRVYYVATNGSVSNPGTPQRPFRTIQHGLNVAVVPGDVVRVRGGTYFGAIGIYVQASRYVRVVHNRVSRSAWGIYVTSEYPGVHSRDVTIADNTVSDNVEAGILVGSPFFPTTVVGATVERNVVLRNGTFEGGNGGNFGIGRARHVSVRRNRFVTSDDHVLTYLGSPYKEIALEDNCYGSHTLNAAKARFGYAATEYVGFRRYQRATGQDRSSTFGPSCD
jgi:hypothetical protein